MQRSFSKFNKGRKGRLGKLEDENKAEDVDLLAYRIKELVNRSQRIR